MISIVSVLDHHDRSGSLHRFVSTVRSGWMNSHESTEAAADELQRRGWFEADTKSAVRWDHADYRGLYTLFGACIVEIEGAEDWEQLGGHSP